MHYIFFTLFTFFISTKVCHAIEFNSADTTNKEYTWIITESNLHDFKLKSIKNTKYKKHKLEEFFEKIITDLENKGYPFAKIDFKTDSINDYKIYGKIYLDKRKKTLIDSIAIKGYNSFPNYLINRHVDIKNNSTYNQKKINNISYKIQSINFIKEYKENEILFNNNKNIIYIYLNKENNNYIDAFIGFNNFNEDLSILGKIHFVIKNSINRFEEIELKWIKSGNNYLRGFLDNYFFSKSFNIINIENIYYINNQTYFSIFSDFGVLYDNEEQIIYSIGIGTGILKNNDIFSVNYAIPNQNNKFDFNDAKLHFNYKIKF